MGEKSRGTRQTPPGELHEQLNEQQLVTLSELELLGWSLKLVNRPLFQEPIAVVVSDDGTEIGLLDPDGKIVVDKSLRQQPGDEDVSDMGLTEECLAGDAELSPEQVEELNVEAVVIATEPEWMEKRKGEAAIPDNLEDYLNPIQLQALRQIENFGWELKFVRRPLFQDPLAVIINNDGDRVGTLEPDGRIDLHHDFALRKESTEPEDDKPDQPASKKQTG